MRRMQGEDGSMCLCMRPVRERRAGSVGFEGFYPKTTTPSSPPPTPLPLLPVALQHLLHRGFGGGGRAGGVSSHSMTSSLGLMFWV